MRVEQRDHPDYPIEYITGKVTFFGREYSVTPDVLIPRLETECLIRRARKLLETEKYDRVIDIGCGSGIIGTSVADLADEVIFVDISASALEVAKGNFLMYFPEKRWKFIVSDLLSSIPSNIYNLESRICILANLPYIKAQDWKNMSADTHFEPELALFGWEETGFEMYERLFEHIWSMKCEVCIIIEFGFDQRDRAEKTIQKYGWKYEFFWDYAGIERFCEITRCDTVNR